ncbi:uncharacterized protein PHALS_07725 [Plasmopara halstedii]|uniref:Uncharacterized protein n=1 Tax=Plasmopara halstedii TaxID=4781 RepID=A0A0P1B7A9_PLAHL|nr:uncharacterized protein PHALS_07725 [Plasmopara halstedii]CEG49992.1 hypothetical protein PHALS_07725 [Plasmopara halstedii]|eukprot:XP_024586361.1 hypothetical protein PHALS_07725 [Plasmopara halstedii]
MKSQEVIYRECLHCQKSLGAVTTTIFTKILHQMHLNRDVRVFIKKPLDFALNEEYDS